VPRRLHAAGAPRIVRLPRIAIGGAVIGKVIEIEEAGVMATNPGGVSGDVLRSFIERIERLEEEKKGIADDIKDVYAEAKAAGFDPKIMRQVIRIRKMDRSERQEQEALLDTYLHAVEGAADTPVQSAGE